MALPGVDARRVPCGWRLLVVRPPTRGWPASSESVAGLGRNQWPDCVGITGRLRSESLAALRRNPHLMPPAKQLLGMELPPPGHIRYPYAWNQCLRHDLRLLRRRPTPAPTRAGQQLNPPETVLRVVRNFVHKDKTKPCLPTSKHFHAGRGRMASKQRLQVSAWWHRSIAPGAFGLRYSHAEKSHSDVGTMDSCKPACSPRLRACYVEVATSPVRSVGCR